jgi:hypothetical protein
MTGAPVRSDSEAKTAGISFPTNAPCVLAFIIPFDFIIPGLFGEK